MKMHVITTQALIMYNFLRALQVVYTIFLPILIYQSVHPNSPSPFGAFFGNGLIWRFNLNCSRLAVNELNMAYFWGCFIIPIAFSILERPHWRHRDSFKQPSLPSGGYCLSLSPLKNVMGHERYGSRGGLGGFLVQTDNKLLMNV